MEKTSMNTKNWLKSYYENANTVSNLDDSALVDECLDIQVGKNDTVSDILSDYILGIPLSKDSRLILEFYYVTYHTEQINDLEA